MNKIYIFTLIALVMFSCKENASNSESTESAKTEKSSVAAIVEETVDDRFTTNPTDLNNRSRNVKLLQGLWENIDDPTKRVEFKNNKKIEIMEGVQADEGTVFSIIDKCEQSNINIQGESKDRFISVLSLNQCYYIAKLNGKTLHLGDMSTGKTLKYQKVVPN